jgi:zinc transporter ZupT
MTPVLAVTAVAFAGSALGVWLGYARARARIVLPFSAGILIGVSLFGLLLEAAAQTGALRALPACVLGYALLLGIDRYLHPICPACSPDHNHARCETALHGFAAPLALATALHAFLDGWGLAVAGAAGGESVRLAVPFALALHKFPEGVALGAMLSAASPHRALAFARSLAVQSATLVGAWAGLSLTPHLDYLWSPALEAFTAGLLLYLGVHAIHGKWKPALTGAAGAAALRVLLR